MTTNQTNRSTICHKCKWAEMSLWSDGGVKRCNHPSQDKPPFCDIAVVQAVLSDRCDYFRAKTTNKQ